MKQPPPRDPRETRGAQKLEAALRRFDLGRAIAGASAIDVGASSGGFTAVLLQQGAREVTAIDVGHGQLAPALREDPRVHVFEKTDFRRAPLALAEGPFSFFSVDVSFMAARNVLRALAFRLQPGARGIVLLKPQFELPKAVLRRGDVHDPALRAQALSMFRERAEALGFRIVAHHDSAVTGGSGTREMFLQLEFEARPARLPQPGERRREANQAGAQRPANQAGAQRPANQASEKRHPKRPARSSSERAAPGAAAKLAWFAVAAPGFEAVLAEELRALPEVSDCEAIAGGATFRGPLCAGYSANLGSRIATRIVVRLGTVEARDFGSLRRGLARLPFEAFLPDALPLRISASSQRSRLYHTGAIAEAVQHAIADRTGKLPERVASAGEERETDSETDREPGADSEAASAQEPFARVLIRGDENRFTLSIDSSGALLHRRGSRVHAGRAPLRETLAAGLLKLADYDPSLPLVNAMCGAGTIAIEAAEIALGRAPGLRRGFAFERFPSFDPAAFAALRARYESQARSELPARIVGFDRDPRAIARARRNLGRASLAGRVELACAELAAFEPPAPPGLFIANPPYGRRLGNPRQIAELHRRLAAELRTRYAGYRVALLVPREVSARTLGLARARSIALQNGGLRVQLLIADA